VRRRYAELAGTAAQGSACCTPNEQAIFGASRYQSEDLGAVSETAADASLGCGNPAVADLCEGEVVLDLGSRGGIDVILSGRRVGTTGKAYGLDTTDELLDLVRRNARRGCGDQRRVSQRPDRTDPPPRRRGRRGHLQLRDHPVHRQSGGDRRDRPRLTPRQALRGQ